MKKIRIQIDLTEQDVATLDQVVENTAAVTRREAMVNALRSYEYLIKEARKGNSVQVVSADGVIHEIVLP